MLAVGGANTRFLELDISLKEPVLRPLADISKDNVLALPG